ncbi:MAG TPA: histidine phosphatase family protein [Acidobacteriaceae bacterium]
MRVIFARHAESAANAGIPCDNFELIPLTEKGRLQAQTLAVSWTETPTHIVSSPFLRTRETAEPTLARFPGVPVEFLPIFEFCNLHSERWSSNDREGKRTEEIRQWEVCDPEYIDGPGAESFSSLHGRAVVALELLKQFPPDALIYAFSHGYFMQAVRMAIELPHLAPAERMRSFLPSYDPRPFRNTDKLALKWNGSLWTII